jgi:CRISPR type III-B/RAMP module RAMP protein Cmr1
LEGIVKLKPLTPIWTGDAERISRTIRETGIIGSLRWWFEALVRGLGGAACDPTKSRCEGRSHCDACALFGCTGWARRFKLDVEEVNEAFAPFFIVKLESSNKPSLLGYYDRSGQGWEKNGGLLGEYHLRITAQNEAVLNTIKFLLKLSCDWGIGIGSQRGFGIAFIDNDLQLKKPDIYIKGLNNPSSNLPRMDQFFFCKIPLSNKGAVLDTIKDKICQGLYMRMEDVKHYRPLSSFDFSGYNFLPTAPWVRRALRGLFKGDNEVLRHYLMGFVSVKGNPKPIHLSCWSHSIEKDKENTYYVCTECGQKGIDDKDVLKKTGSKIFVSNVYNKNAFKVNAEPEWEMKVWGWIPDLPGGIGADRQDVKKKLQAGLKSEDFWKKCFGIAENPVEINRIKVVWDVDVEKLLTSGGEVL